MPRRALSHTFLCVIPLILLSPIVQSSSIFWRNSQNGQTWSYVFDNSGWRSQYINTVPSAWQAYLGDLNGDDQQDIVWRNSETGVNWGYLMNGKIITQSQQINQASTEWNLMGLADLNNDDKDDMIWRNTDGRVWVYLMDGLTINHSHRLATVSDDQWKIVGLGDFNGDGHHDLLWRHMLSGATYIYQLQNGYFQQGLALNVVGPDWNVATIADVNGDDTDDIIWRNQQSGLNWVYRMANNTIQLSYSLNQVADINWQLVGGTDLNQDNQDDLIWRHQNTGKNVIYYLANGQISQISQLNTTPLQWQWVDHQGQRKLLQESPLEKALRTGDAAELEPETLISAAIDTIDDAKASSVQLLSRLYNLNADGSPKADNSSLTQLTWNPTHDAALLGATYGQNTPVLETNSVFVDGYTIQQKPIVIAGTKDQQNNRGRYMAFGSHPLRNLYRDANSVNQQMNQFVLNSLSWLTQRDEISQASLNIVIAHQDQSFYFPDEVATRAWLDTNLPNARYNDENTCDGQQLSTCITPDTDLLIISQIASDQDSPPDIAETIADALNQNVAVLYFHHNGNITPLGQQIFKQLDIGYTWDNYWRKLQVENYSPTMLVEHLPQDIQSIKTTLAHLKSDSFTVDLSLCDDKSCPESSEYQTQFLDGAQAIKQMLNQLDTAQIRLFDKASYRLPKLLLLACDQYRQDVTYPMDKNATQQVEFLSSLLADHCLYYSRDIAPAQPDMGNFSRSDFSHISPVTKNVLTQSKRHFRSSGAYALPGQTFGVTRTDNANVETTIFINTLRSGATHEFQTEGYKRPKHLQSPKFSITPGQTLHLTSSYGGPIQIGFDTNNQNVAFTFTQVGEHPYWNGEEDNIFFTAALAQADYDWAEMVTPGFEVHSKIEKMQTSLSESPWSSPAEIAAATERYVHNYPHILAGFQGPGIDTVNEIIDFASSRGWQVDTIDLVKHMNADQANCGYGCSGNPYDAYWSFNPIGHGDLHELGHGLERGRFRFEGWDGHASTNFYSYYSKSRYHLDTGSDPSCQNLPFDSLSSLLTQSRMEADPFSFMQAANLTSWSQGAAIYVQIFKSAQAEGVVDDGWHVLGRLHILDREFNRADNSDAEWLAARETLGFTLFTREEAKALSKNDWLAIALSVVTQRDMRNYIHMWGLAIGNDAQQQIAALNLPTMPTTFYDYPSNNAYCLGL